MNDHGNTGEALDLTALRARLQQSRGQQYWRSLEELADTEEFRKLLQDEFPQHRMVWENTLNRRDFMRLMGASLALAGLSACTKQPQEKIFPYVKAPEELVDSQPLFFATALLRGGYANGVLVESHTGRPIKVEGNPDHPASLGATDVFAQAEVLGLYDPDRAQVVRYLGQISTWDQFVTAISTALVAQRAKGGAGLRLLTETVTSPTLASQMQALLAVFPEAQWHQYEPTGRDQARAGARLFFGEFVETHYRFDQAEVVLSLDADFLIDLPGSLRYARDFAGQRRVADQAKMNRLYMIESSPTLTGGMADHRLARRASDIGACALALAQELDVPGLAPPAGDSFAPADQKWIQAVARDLQHHRGAAVVIAGEQQPPEVHALAHALNHHLGNVGKTVIHTAPVEARPVIQGDSVRQLVADMQAGRVELLLMLGGNPVYNAPADLQFAEALQQVPLRIHLSSHEDETARLCHWHLHEQHPLESWSDARAFDGTVTILQPLIAPLYGGKSAHEVLNVFLGQPTRAGHETVRDYWKAQRPGADFETFWQTAVHDGVVAGTVLPPKNVTPNWSVLAGLPLPQAAAGLEIIIRPDPTVGDGRYANNGWLQELPKPLSKLTWENAACLSPATAERLGVASGEVVTLTLGQLQVTAPVWIMPGHAPEAITVHLGYGRTRAGKVGTGIGFNAYALRTSTAPWHATGVEVHKTGKRQVLATTQTHHSMENRHLVRVGTLAQYQEHPDFVQEMGHEPPRTMTLYPEHKYEGYAWGMAIDLNACLGCNACTVACQAENNIPVVGKEQVATGREMHWIRLDRYYEGDLDDPAVYHQPVPCMHCENAPCEPVCPVGATVHSDEGLNDMVYNRCVGTRYCANNCPYKVRRFNFMLYSDFETPSLKLLHNPEVTVRSRGVMEKCTYCVQRINSARIAAKREERDIRDGEVLTACQQVCPTQAIAFGNLNDPDSRVARLKEKTLNYGLLTDLNTRPRTTYLARLRNPNPELGEGGEHA